MLTPFTSDINFNFNLNISGAGARVSKRSRPSHLDRHWSMPNKLVDFLCNLPRTAQALPVRSLHWLVRQIWVILDEKVRACTRSVPPPSGAVARRLCFLLCVKTR
jgi:hypothetical protein